MSTSRPFPAHVPTLTEVVEETPIPEPRFADILDPLPETQAGGAIVSDFVAEELSLPPLAHDIAVLTEVVSESEVLPPVDALLDVAADQSDDGRVVEAAESGDLTDDLGEDLADQITENLSASLTPVIEQIADQLLRNLQTELNQRLRQMVAQAVAQELKKRSSS